MKRKKFALVRRFFAVARIRLIWFDIFLEQVNREEKSHIDWTNRHILEQVNGEEKKTKLLVSCLLIKSLCLANGSIHLRLKPHFIQMTSEKSGFV